MKKEKGITLIALVITIIVLLILAGVSLSLVAGSDGILSKAGKAVQKNKIATAKEVAELAIMDIQADYFDEAYVEGTYSGNKTNYISEKLKDGIESSDYFVQEDDAGKIKVYKGNETIASGTLDENGKTNWDDEVEEGTPQNRRWTQNKVSVTNGAVTLTVGSKVSGYEANGVSDWYVLGAENGKLLITTNYNVTTVTLEGQEGYTNGIATLNTVAEAYTDTNFAEGKARTIDVDDINRVTGYEPDVVNFNNGASTVLQWKNEVTYRNDGEKIYSKGTKYPTTETESSYTSFTYWAGSAWKSLASGESATIIQTYYCYYPQTLTSTLGSGTQIKDVPNSEAAYNLLFANTTGSGYYWLGSQYVYANVGYVHFSMRYVREGYVYGDGLCSSDGSTYSPSFGVRPVVSLKSGIKVGSDGSLSL